jgi:hypothetical protein
MFVISRPVFFKQYPGSLLQQVFGQCQSCAFRVINAHLALAAYNDAAI